MNERQRAIKEVFELSEQIKDVQQKICSLEMELKQLNINQSKIIDDYNIKDWEIIDFIQD